MFNVTLMLIFLLSIIGFKQRFFIGLSPVILLFVKICLSISPFDVWDHGVSFGQYLKYLL